MNNNNTSKHIYYVLKLLIFNLKKSKYCLLLIDLDNLNNLLTLYFMPSININNKTVFNISINYLEHNSQYFRLLKIIFEKLSVIIVNINYKSNFILLKNKFNININNPYFDITLGLYLLNTNLFTSNNNRKSLLINKYQYLNSANLNLINSITYYQQYLFLLNKNIYLIKKMLIFNKLYQNLKNTINQNPELKQLLISIDMPLSTILANMEIKGIIIDINLLNKFAKNIIITLKIIKTKIFKLTSKTFNLLSVKEVTKLLIEVFNQIKNPICIKTILRSTNADTLQLLSNYHQLPKLILLFRKLYKLFSTYINKFNKCINLNNNKISTTFYQTLTTTGRLSSRNPNLQNVPNYNQFNMSYQVKKMFIASPHCSLVSIDYSQIELRIVAYLANELKLIEAFKKNQDIHLITATKIFNKSIINISEQERKQAKIINFSIIYGITPFGLAKKLNIDIKTAKLYLKVYFKKYNRIYHFMKQIYQHVLNYEYVKTIHNRIIFIPKNLDHNHQLSVVKKLALNNLIQGSAADIVKKAMIYINCWLNKYYYHKYIKILLQIHDELIFEVADKKLYLVHQLKELMENKQVCKNILLPTNIKIGKRWSEI